MDAPWRRYTSLTAAARPPLSGTRVDWWILDYKGKRPAGGVGHGVGELLLVGLAVWLWFGAPRFWRRGVPGRRGKFALNT